ncbi:MAG: DeoR family transcriptional regulator [Bacteroidetes bacterium]|nr:MAG: DeoR family transcriptional regulator [Bacteroidota bacterium]PTM10278.1 MAG: DeoR family transcriptional regulator [Bacteroidota bacterium]
MLKKERQGLILREVNIHNKVLLSDLSEKFTVSEDTIRRDLQELADRNKLIKVRGGALSRSYHSYSYRENDIYAFQEKLVIARKAVSLLRDGMLVLISGGSTNLEIARILPPELKATFLTVSLSTALQLLEHPNCETIFLGGLLSPTAKITIGGEVVAQLNQVRPDLCFMGANAIDPDRGLSDSDWEVVVVKRAMVQASARTVILAITEKLGSTQKIKICDLEAIDYLITELPPEHDELKPYRNKGVKVM